MSTFQIKMPKLGESITEGTIISWSVKVGDTIHEDDVLFEVNTAKVSAEIPSPVEGKIVEILFNEGDTVDVGVVVALVQLQEEGEGDGDASQNVAPSASKQEAAAPVTTATTVVQKLTRGDEEKWYSPVVLAKSTAGGVTKEELDALPGTGYLGRVSKQDIEAYLENKKRGVTAPIALTSSVAALPTVPAIPIVAAQGDEVIAMDAIRRIIADRMVASKKISPHVTNVIEVDVTKLVRWREANKDAFKQREGVSLTYMPAIAEATAKALKDYPRINSSVDGYNIIQKKRINVGIAVSLNDGNLIVPVIKDADKLSISGLATAIASLAGKARSNKLMADDIQGGTFTITNFGSFKSLFGTPIINQPEAAILGVGTIEKKAVVVETPEGDVIAIRHRMYLSLSYDHRVVDGSLGGNFVHRIGQYLENWNA